MNRRSSRRDALKQLGLGVTGAAVLGSPLAWATGRRGPARIVPGLRDLSRRLSEARRADAFEVAAEAIRQGATRRDLLGATYLAGVQDIAPRPVGNALHAVLMVESTFLLGDSAEVRDAWKYAFWALDAFKVSQGLDRNNGDWKLGPAPEQHHRDVKVARDELVRAMEDWDVARADVALTSLAKHADLATVFGTLRPYAARSSVDLGHKAVIFAHTERTLARLGWNQALPALRAMGRSLLHTRGSARFDAVDRGALDRMQELPDAWQDGQESPDRSLDLFRSLRDRSASDALGEVVAAFQDGLGPDSVWDALRLFAHDVFFRRTSEDPEHGGTIGPVHAVTASSSLARSFRGAERDADRRRIVLATVGWICELRDEVRRRGYLRDMECRIDHLHGEPGFDEGSNDLFELDQPSVAATRCFLATSEEHDARLVRRLHASLARHAVETHQHKYAAALFEDAAVCHPRWRPMLLAVAVPYLPLRLDGESDLHHRTVHALKSAGVI